MNEKVVWNIKGINNLKMKRVLTTRKNCEKLGDAVSWNHSFLITYFGTITIGSSIFTTGFTYPALGVIVGSKDLYITYGSLEPKFAFGCCANLGVVLYAKLPETLL